MVSPGDSVSLKIATTLSTLSSRPNIATRHDIFVSRRTESGARNEGGPAGRPCHRIVIDAGEHPGMLDVPSTVACGSPGTSRRTLQLAVVTETWPPEVNGVAMSIARLVAGLRQRGHVVELVRPCPGSVATLAAGARQPFSTAVDAEILTGSLPIPRYPDLRMGVPSARRLAAHWRRQPPGLVHIATEGPLGWSALRAARALRLPV